ncbi:benzodiazapine receptor [Rhizobium sp. SG_E_25_P2]|jgi:translocator protein|uniref:TspO/MBR family protein n=1 Tax=Rhizobium sp. SG_E_25_P2 TaxID=2879942 RepID=UPI002475E92A|nr:tryptophan-rich sensory protein [Rhizobium sp. SG_E_25_P2]MDH6266813.1 benzodiazapine receptor [Rhizobium sp. SG_E_25_P2]
MPHTLRSALTLVAFVAVVLGVGIYIGVTNPPGDWYANLRKPVFNPPNWVFAPAWTVLYILIAIAGWRVFERDRNGPALKLWVAQMALNWAWSPAWFGLHWRWGSVAIIAVLWLTILGFIALNRRDDRISALLFAPYLAWVSFAAILNVSLVAMNP